MIGKLINEYDNLRITMVFVKHTPAANNTRYLSLSRNTPGNSSTTGTESSFTILERSLGVRVPFLVVSAVLLTFPWGLTA